MQNQIRRLSPEKQRLNAVIAAVQSFAPYLGYSLAAVGWLLFFLCLCELHDLGPIHGPGAKAFHGSGCFIVVGWLFLRLGDGLFPFGVRLFHGQKDAI